MGIGRTNQLASKCHLIIFIELCIDSMFAFTFTVQSLYCMVYGFAKTLTYAHFDNKFDMNFKREMFHVQLMDSNQTRVMMCVCGCACVMTEK